nr:MAG TPA: Single strand binding protein [Caudoviricetes sp.]
MNKVILMGRLTRDPEIRVSVATNITTAKFTLAVDRKYKKEGEQQTADFISCAAFGKTAESIERYLHQGTKIVVAGRIQTGSYTNKDGNKVYTTDIVVEEYEFAESKNANGGSPSQPASNMSAPAMASDGFMNLPLGVEDTGLPFN